MFKYSNAPYHYWIFTLSGWLVQIVDKPNDAAFAEWNRINGKSPFMPMSFRVFSNNPNTEYCKAATLRVASELAAAHIPA